MKHQGLSEFYQKSSFLVSRKSISDRNYEVMFADKCKVEFSQMMRHRNIRTTQIYAEITGTKIEEDMQLLPEKIKDDYSLVGG